MSILLADAVWAICLDAYLVEYVANVNWRDIRDGLTLGSLSLAE